MTLRSRYLNMRMGDSAIRPLSGQYLSNSSWYTKEKSTSPLIRLRRLSCGTTMSYKALYSLNTNSCCCDSISILFYAVKVQKNPHIAKYYTDYVQNSSVKKGQVGLFQCPPRDRPLLCQMPCSDRGIRGTKKAMHSIAIDHKTETRMA